MQDGPPGAPTILLLHGWLATGALNWYQCFAPLAGQATVITIDHRGHGRGIRSRRRFRLADCADDTAAALRRLDTGPVVAIGYSMGGPVAQLLWRRHGDLVAGLGFVATGTEFVTGNRHRYAASALLVSLDALPEKPLVAQVPVSLRGDADRGHMGTKVAAMYATLATDIADPAERLMAISQGTIDAKTMRRSLDADHTVNLSDTLPPAAIAIAARAWSAAGLDARTPPVFNLIVSNVAGPPFDLHVAGARISAMYPMGPLLYGSGLNVTVASTPRQLDFGLLACRDRVPDAWALADRIPPALDELVATID